MSTADLADAWPHLHAELRRIVPASQYEIWLAPLQPGDVEDGRLVVLAPEELRGWVAERFTGALRRAATATLGEHVARGVEVRALEGTRPTGAPRPAPSGAPRAPAAPSRPPAKEKLNPRFTFEQFVIGEANRFAHAAALAVAELPGQAYNPLFLYGPPGVGKTHLLHAIGNYVTLYGGGLSVRYTTVERFTNEFVSAIRAGGMDAFKEHYRRVDVLLVDDVQFLAAKAKTEQELFHTINALHEAGSQLVLTCDRLPADLDAVEQRLRERFAAGLVADIKPPDRATRLAVLRKRAHHDGVDAGIDVLEVLADGVTGNVRALEGALIRVVAFASLTDEPITADLARRVLRDLYGDRPGPGAGTGPAAGGVGSLRTAPEAITVERIQALACEAFGLTHDELVGPGRTARVAWPRQVAMFLAREHTSESLPRIGDRFGGRDHTTVLHACRRTAERMASEPEAHEAVRALTAKLTGAGAPGDADRP